MLLSPSILPPGPHPLNLARGLDERYDLSSGFEQIPTAKRLMVLKIMPLVTENQQSIILFVSQLEFSIDIVHK